MFPSADRSHFSQNAARPNATRPNAAPGALTGETPANAPAPRAARSRLSSLDGLLDRLEREPGWSERRQFRHLCQHWAAVVGPAVAARARPYALQRGVLQVAVESGAWAQTLTFERGRILANLRDRLPSPEGPFLADIRFSTARWGCAPSNAWGNAWGVGAGTAGAEGPDPSQAAPALPVPYLGFADRRGGDRGRLGGEPGDCRRDRAGGGDSPTAGQPGEPRDPDRNWKRDRAGGGDRACDPEGAFRRWADRVRSRSADCPRCPNCGLPAPGWELARWSVCGACVVRRWADRRPQGGAPASPVPTDR